MKHLDLSRCQNSGNNEEDVLVQITASCQLEKLSLGCLYISNNFVKSIQKSALTLKVLDLSDCRGKKWLFIKEYFTCFQYLSINMTTFFEIFHQNPILKIIKILFTVGMILPIQGLRSWVGRIGNTKFQSLPTHFWPEPYCAHPLFISFWHCNTYS